MNSIKNTYTQLMRGPWAWKIVKKTFFWFLTLSIGLTLLLKWTPVPVTFFMLQRCVLQKIEGSPMRLEKDWEPLHKMGNSIQLAVVCAEDQNFLTHHGFDLKAIKKAMEYNKKMEDRGKEKRRGASTISQQTAKNVFLWHGRSWLRKGLEVYFTFLIETFWSKERILEVYLNVIELGDGIYGAEAASLHFYRKSALKMSPNEAALMAVVLPNPRSFSIAKPSGHLKKRQNWCSKQMRQWGGKLIFE